MTDAQEELEARLRGIFSRAGLGQSLRDGEVGDNACRTPQDAVFVGIVADGDETVFIGACRRFTEGDLLHMAQATTAEESLLAFRADASFLGALSALPTTDRWIVNGRMGGVMPLLKAVGHAYRVMGAGGIDPL